MAAGKTYHIITSLDIDTEKFKQDCLERGLILFLKPIEVARKVPSENGLLVTEDPEYAWVVHECPDWVQDHPEVITVIEQEPLAAYDWR